MKIVMMVAIPLAVLAGCSNSKSPSKSNFEHAINDWIEKDPPCLSIPQGSLQSPGQDYGALPRYVAATPATQPFAEQTRQRYLAPLDALVDAGLMKKSWTEIAEKQMFGSSEKKVPVVAYDLADKGKSALKPENAKGDSIGQRLQLCYGKPEVVEIKQFTQPGDMMGMTVSQVSYSYHLADLPDWAKNAKMKEAFPDLARNTAESIDRKAAVVLTNDGWKHEKAI